MKIISISPVRESLKFFRIICKNCKAIFEFMEDECRKYGRGYEIECPVCGVTNHTENARGECIRKFVYVGPGERSYISEDIIYYEKEK